MLAPIFGSGTPLFGDPHTAVVDLLGAPTVERRIEAERGGWFPGLRSRHRRAEGPATPCPIWGQVRVPHMCPADEMIKDVMHGMHGKRSDARRYLRAFATFAMRRSAWDEADYQTA